MTRYLYIFVDESGNPSSGEYYVVAGAWCISDEPNPSRALQSTTDNLAGIANSLRDSSTPVSELKGSQLPIEVLLSVVESLNGGPAFDDPSVKHQQLPWSGSRPIRFTIHGLNPVLGIEVLKETLGGSALSSGSSHPEALQSLSLATILNPLVQAEIIDLMRIDQVKVVLDAQVWQAPVNRIEAGLDVVESVPENITFETRDSAQTPGLQLADIAAYTWGRQLRSGDCGSGVAYLDNLRLSGD
ncbi:DUF3800 domain-containing protein [Natrialba sp. SSL1]|uniref:DUF3800 domain-containing protein n=1 Tax=Natrialba sp. SSL1 TaxID=1869245 RepID=UPI001113D16B|nr:DUF3800 domain-containing protein [Natrialba sp. SSL1]